MKYLSHLFSVPGRKQELFVCHHIAVTLFLCEVQVSASPMAVATRAVACHELSHITAWQRPWLRQGSRVVMFRCVFPIRDV